MLFMFNRPLFIHRKREKKNYRFCRFFFCAEKCVLFFKYFFYSSAGKIIWQQWWWCGREWEEKKENCNFTLTTRLSSYMNAGCISPYVFMFVSTEFLLLFFYLPFLVFEKLGTLKILIPQQLSAFSCDV